MALQQLTLGLEKFVCDLYCYKHSSNINSIRKLRWYLWEALQKALESLPPTRATLESKIIRAKYRKYIMKNALITNPILPDPIDYALQIKKYCLKLKRSEKDSIPADISNCLRL